jgi:hypothetical protein
LHFDSIVFRIVPEPDVHPRIILREKARPRLDFAGQSAAACEYVDAGAHRVAIALHSDALHQQPFLLWSEILQQARTRAKIIDHYFQRTIVVEIASGGTP